ncbi:hypothetical protein GCM10023093_00440 [Nemorincola caseinilytica]|uniref:Ig-like domain-containing protein n=2 Tax=Nemorincola caseinilytica TaxID=2054315 RepID=A0ABP8N3N8_9BACT
MTPTNSGGFENGPTFAASNWQEANGGFNPWVVGNGSVNIGMRGAYIGTTTMYTGTNNASINHFYRIGGGLVIPAGATNVMLSFRYRQPVVDPMGDSLIVSVSPNAAPAPVAGSTVSPLYTRIYNNTSTAYPGYVQVGPIDLTAYAGTTIRLAYTYVNNGTAPIGIPAIDSVAMYYCPAITGTMVMCTSGSVTLNTTNNVAGGTWSSSNTSIAAIGGSTVTSATVNGGTTAGTATITHIGGTCTVTATVTVNPIPTALSGTLSACAGSTTVLTSTPAGGTWSSSNTAVATVTSGTVNALTAGTANITYMFQPSCRAISTVTVNPLPAVFNVTGGGSFCASGSGVSIGLDNSTAGMDHNLYNGATLVGSVSSSPGGPISFGTFTTGGTYTATATNPATTCTRNMAGSAVVTVAPPVTPDVDIISSVTGTLCSGTGVTFTADPVNEGTSPAYNWYVNGTLVGTGTTYSYVPTDADVVRVTLYPGGICAVPDTATTTMTMAVTPLGTPGVNISVAPGNPSCEGRPVTFSAVPVLGGTAPGYRWTKNGINVATGPTYTYTPANGDVVYCMITSNYICRSIDTALSTDITMTTIPSASLPVVSIAATPGTMVDPGTMVTLVASKTGGTSAVTYQWHVNGTQIPGATNNTYNSNSFVNGDIVTCKVTNTDPCANFTLKSIVINTTGAGVANIDGNTNMAIIPNPNNGVFSLQGSMTDNAATIKVTNLIGQMVYSREVKTTGHMMEETIDLSNMPAGVYILSVHSVSGTRSMHFSIR